MMEKFFSPRSVVVIGASEKNGKIGNDLLKNLSGKFLGKIFGVNPKGGGFSPKNSSSQPISFYQNISNLPEIPDVAIIAIPATFVENSLKECGEFGIKNIIIISAGFKESGNISGEKKIKILAKKYELNILGPNCLGMINTHKNLNLSFAEKIPQKGNISLISQSGAMATALMDFAQSSHLGFSKIISMGNKSGLNENDFLEYLENDEETKVIVLYLEDFGDGRKFFEHCKRITKKKPIIVVKSGVSKKGALAATSHTGALSGERVILETAFRQSGVIYTHFLEELFLWSQFFSVIQEEDLQKELIIITNAGGPGVMAIDNAEKFGISLAEFSQKEQKILKKNLPTASSVTNPIDILGDATSNRYKTVLENISELEKKRNILVMLTHQTVTDSENIAHEIISFQKKNPDTVIMTSFMGGASVQKAREIINNNLQKNFLHFNYPKEGIKALSQFQKWKKWKDICDKTFLPKDVFSVSKRSKDIDLLREKIKKFQGDLLPSQLVSEIFAEYDIPFLEEKLATSPEEAEKFFEIIGGPVVMKVSSSDIPHKTDCGGVVINIKTKKEAREIFSQIVRSSSKAYPSADIRGVSVQKMMSNDREVFVGMTRDKTFGEVLLFGLGGIYVNIFEDISRRLSPVSREEVQIMMTEIRSASILQGTRGAPSIDFISLENIIMKVSELFHNIPEIFEIDLNPIFVTENGAWVVDTKFFV